MRRIVWAAAYVVVFTVTAASAVAQTPGAESLCSAANDDISNRGDEQRLGADAVGFWKRFRKRHPLHVQGSVAGALPAGGLVVVVAEPPPRATREEIARRLGASVIGVFKTTIGCDGWVQDVVAVLGPRDPLALDESLTRLDAYLFGTSYRSQQLDLEPDRRARDLPPLDVSVSPAELRDWTFGSGAAFLSADGALEVKGADLAGASARGVFVSVAPGIVLWGIPVRSNLCELEAEARQFSLESDLVFGAIKNGNDVLIIGRERLLSPDVYPPLRFESLLALAATQGLSLAQSFQRLNLFAGKLKSGDDWAPILLSDELQGTEFGSLLDQTDQMLKSWSMNGQVKYQNFGYPNPRWANGKPVADVLHAEMLTFNWNTGGATTLTRERDLEILAVQRTGALPITYVPEGTEALEAATVENQYHDFFASLQNPLLARAVAYTTLFEIFKKFEISAACLAPDGADRAGEAYLERRARKLIALVRASDQGLRERLRPLARENTESFLASLKGIFDEVHKRAGEAGIAELAHDLAGVTRPSPLFEGIYERAANLSKDGGVRRLAQLEIDPDAAMREYVARARPRSTAWLRAPSVVVSRFHSDDALVIGEGGHNLDVAPADVEVNPSVPRRQPRLVTNGRRQARLTINPDDLASLPDLTPFLKRAQNGRTNAAALAAEMATALRRAPPRTVRPERSALAFDRYAPYWRGRRTAGWAVEPLRPSGAPSRSPNGPDLLSIRRDPEGYELLLPGFAAFPKSKSTISLTEHVSGYLASVEGKEVRIQLEGFSPEQAEMFRLTLKRSHNGSRKDLVALTGEVSASERPIDPRRTIVSIESPREVSVEGRQMFECAVQIKEPNVLVRFVLSFHTKISGPILDTIRAIVTAALDRRPATSRALVREIRDELRASLPVGSIDVIVTSGDATDHIIAQR
jgi:hypothetical protein